MRYESKPFILLLSHNYVKQNQDYVTPGNSGKSNFAVAYMWVIKFII